MIVALIVIVIAVIFIRKSKKASDQLKAHMEEIGALDVFFAFHVEGLGIAPKEFCKIFRLEDKIFIESKNSKFEIGLERIRAAVVKNERELIEKGKSVVGRAVIGTLLVPGLGTIVGGMSGIGTKRKKGKVNTFFIVNYINSLGELTAVTFLNNFNLIRINKFCRDINKSLPTSNGQVIQL